MCCLGVDSCDLEACKFLKGLGSRLFVDIKTPGGLVKAKGDKDLLDNDDCSQADVFEDNAVI